MSDGFQDNGNVIEEDTDAGFKVRSSHSDDPKVLRVRFTIPREHYKGSNTGDNDITSRQKSAWLRAYGEKVWGSAIEHEFGLIALEPSSWNLSSTDYTLTERKAFDDYDAQKRIVSSLEDKISQMESGLSALKTENRTIPRSAYKHVELSGKIRAVEDDLRGVKLQYRLESKILTRYRNMFRKTHEKQDRRRSNADRKSYIKEKLALNEKRLLFPGIVRFDVRSNVITKHDFDAPNCWPTVKPLQDGGTDTCVLWHDDNNNFIKHTSFYGGGKVSKDKYVIDVIVTELENSDHDPFDDQIFLDNLDKI
jgi:hypothetical protein